MILGAGISSARDVISRVSLTVVDTAEARKLDIVISVAAARLSIRWPLS